MGEEIKDQYKLIEKEINKLKKIEWQNIAYINNQ
jgi:hypothetical protein